MFTVVYTFHGRAFIVLKHQIFFFAFSALALLVERQEEHRARKTLSDKVLT